MVCETFNDVTDGCLCCVGIDGSHMTENLGSVDAYPIECAVREAIARKTQPSISYREEIAIHTCYSNSTFA